MSPSGMIPSRFNIAVVHEARHFVFNTRTMALCEVNPKLARLLCAGPGESARYDGANAGHLTELGLLVDDCEDELAALQFRHIQSKHSPEAMTLIIVPTLACNLACPYCYEERSPATMSDEVMDAVVNLVGRRAHTLKSLRIRWLGGEPTLSWPCLQRITDGIQKLADESGFRFAASMATNGYALDRAMCTQLQSMNIESVQITIDGPQDLHDQRRILRGGGGTYHRIVENLKMAAEYVDVVVRVNLDRSNFPEFPRLLGGLEEAGIPKDRVRLFCRPVVACGDAEGCLSYSEFGAAEGELVDAAIQYGFEYGFHPNSVTSLRCPAYHANSWVIGPGGECQRCPAHIGNGVSPVATLEPDGSISLHRRRAYCRSVLADPFTDAECRDCAVLPLCWGRCQLVDGMDAPAERSRGCIPEKLSLAEKIRYLIHCHP